MNIFISFALTMNRLGIKSVLFSFALFLSTLSDSHAQSLTGIWRGYFITESGERYKLEFQIDNSSNFSKGVSYSYLDVRFYGKATMTGSYSKPGKNLKIREIKTVEVKNMTGGGACIMNYNLIYSKSGREEFLEGSYLGKQEVKYGDNPFSWGSCGSGKVFLRRVVSSDFYVEPFLKGKIKNVPVLVNQPPQRKTDTVKTKPPVVANKPVVVNKPVIVNKPPVKTNPPVVVTKPVVKPTIPPNTKKDTVKKIVLPPVVKTNPPVVIPKPEVLKTRSNELVKTLTVTAPEVTVKIYDNGEIDDDTISVYFNNKLVLSSKRLTASPLTVNLKLDNEDAVYELTMVAENLGRIPPNTSLMIVEAGEQRFDVRITSNQQKNAVVRFKYQKP
jgi:hypothetical protein